MNDNSPFWILLIPPKPLASGPPIALNKLALSVLPSDHRRVWFGDDQLRGEIIQVPRAEFGGASTQAHQLQFPLRAGSPGVGNGADILTERGTERSGSLAWFVAQISSCCHLFLQRWVCFFYTSESRCNRCHQPNTVLCLHTVIKLKEW